MANILLDDLDRELARRGHRFCRYADHCNIYVRSLAAGQRVMESVVRFLEQKLRLRVNREKSAVAPVGERKFLGYPPVKAALSNDWFRLQGLVSLLLKHESLHH